MPEEKKEEKKSGLTIEQIAEMLDPEIINKKIVEKHSKARVTHKSDKIKVADWEEFNKEIVGYMKHHYKAAKGIDISDEDATTEVREILEKDRREGGMSGAYEKARQGKLHEIFNRLAEGIEQNHVRAYNTYVFNKIDPHDWDSHLAFTKDYMSKYKQFLPKEYKTKSPEELAKNYTDLIQHHMGVVSQVKEMMKKYEAKKKPEEGEKKK